MHASTVILISFVTSVATAVGTAYLVERYEIVKDRDAAVGEATVPELKGLAEADARSSAAAAGLTFVVSSREETAQAAPGTVLSQSLAVGQKVRPQQTLSVVLAQALPKVPTVTGLAVEDATKRLKDGGYTVQLAGSVPDAKVPVGSVARQLPEAESDYVRGAAVTLQLSSGPADVEMPAFVGQPYNKAMKEAESLGLKVAVAWMSRGETPTYVVLNQSPTAKTKLDPGAQITFTVNR